MTMTPKKKPEDLLPRGGANGPYDANQLKGLEETRDRKKLEAWETNTTLAVRADKATLAWLKSLSSAGRGDVLDAAFRDLPLDEQKRFEEEFDVLRPIGWVRPKIAPHKPHERKKKDKKPKK